MVLSHGWQVRLDEKWCLGTIDVVTFYLFLSKKYVKPKTIFPLVDVVRYICWCFLPAYFYVEKVKVF